MSRGKIRVNGDTFFSRIGIFGVGLMGGSLGLALRERSPRSTVIGIGRNAGRLKEALRCGAIHEYATDPSTIDPPLDLLVVCTPVRMVAEHVRLTLPSLAPQALVTDVGSTKETVVQQCEDVLEGGPPFVGSHPMAGSHKTGIEAATPDLYENRVCVVTHTPRSPLRAIQRIHDFWQSIGMRVVLMTPEQHDELTAFSSHLPHVTAAALCHAVMSKDPLVEQVLGNGFRDSTRIAAGDAELWLDICMENRESILCSIQSLKDILHVFYTALEQCDEETVRVFLAQAQKWRMKMEPGGK